MERRHKICIYCINYIPETDKLEGECKHDEDIKSDEFCEVFEKRGK